MTYLMSDSVLPSFSGGVAGVLRRDLVRCSQLVSGQITAGPLAEDYAIKHGQAVRQEAEAPWVWGKEGNAFAEPLIQVLDEEEASQALLFCHQLLI